MIELGKGNNYTNVTLMSLSFCYNNCIPTLYDFQETLHVMQEFKMVTMVRKSTELLLALTDCQRGTLRSFQPFRECLMIYII